MKHWSKLGMEFEEIYYTENKYTNIPVFINKYRELQKKIHEQKQQEGTDTINFLTDLIHLIAKCTCLKGKNWLTLKLNEQSSRQNSVTQNIQNTQNN